MPEEIKKEYVPVDTGFIENLMPYAPAVYTVIYLCALSMGSQSEAAEVARKLNMAVNDVAAAAMYWQDRRLLRFEDNKFIFNCENTTMHTSQRHVNIEKAAPEKKFVLSSQPPKYEPEELAQYADKNADVKRLFEMAQSKLGRMLTHSDLSSVFSIYHWMGLKMEVIELLFDFCVKRGHRNMRYIERVAVDWCESGINSEEAAKDRIRAYSTVYRGIMKAMGQSVREPVSGEIKYMKKWLEEYKLPEELINLACAKTVMSTGKASFGYADKILQSWHKAGFKTTAEVEQSEKAFSESKKQASQSAQPKNASSAPKQNRFINYSQRKYDYAEIERLEREKLKSEVNW